ncbi:DUF4337 domain-containing protein [Paenibacillus sp. GP183]|uniref:DUF4337 domain-containing protein n=1 Tax=Paenibacillus sp. GP183 TaxID=1882751 RepID=UPI0008988FD1|nr:DUF4337 domain-containing protein [Paenibacillus sp. GP183]SEC10524.1 protein of unknown function [Paenibacillus sp. GP183]
MGENFGIENPLEKVEEEIKELEEHERKHNIEEKDRNRFNSIIAVTISIYAVLTAYVGLKESQITTDTLLEMDNAVLLQSQASDQWAYYQAKSIKGEIYKSQSKSLSSTGNQQSKEIQNEFDANSKRYDTEKKDIEQKANELEKLREEKIKETSALVHKHHSTGIALTFLQISIVLASVSSLLRKKILWYASIGTSVIGLLYFISTYLH